MSTGNSLNPVIFFLLLSHAAGDLHFTLIFLFNLNSFMKIIVNPFQSTSITTFSLYPNRFQEFDNLIIRTRKNKKLFFCKRCSDCRKGKEKIGALFSRGVKPPSVEMDFVRLCGWFQWNFMAACSFTPSKIYTEKDEKNYDDHEIKSWCRDVIENVVCTVCKRVIRPMSSPAQ